jgi:hypothetical protein
MRSAKHVFFLSVLVFFITGAALASGKPEQSKSGKTPVDSNTRFASCVVKVTVEPAILPVNFEMVEWLIRSSGVAGKASREVLELPPHEGQEFFYLEQLFGSIPYTKPRPEPDPDYMDMDADGMGPMMMERDRSRVEADRLAEEDERDRLRRSRRSRRDAEPGVVGGPVINPLPEHLLPEGVVIFRLEVELPEDYFKQVAEEFMSALVENLRETISEACVNVRRRFITQLDQANEEVERVEGRLAALQGKLNEISGTHVIWREFNQQELDDLRNEIEAAELRLAESRLTKEAIVEKISRTQALVEKRLEDDLIAKELQATVEANAKQLAEMEASGKFGFHDLQEFRENLIRARMELAERREQISNDAGARRVESLNEELQELLLRERKTEHYLSQMQQKQNKLTELMPKADKYELLEMKIDIARDSLEDAIRWRDELQRRFRMIQEPTVTIIGGALTKAI